MNRAIEKELKVWKEKKERKPLLLRGARQIGKTFIIERFGMNNYKSFVTVNFEETKEAKNAFGADLSPDLIIRDLSARLRVPIIPEETLLFFDEIQACPAALQSLRFFKEKMPQLHLIAAGSLLEFILSDESYSFPVGRIENLHMYPLSFCEFLEARGEGIALEWIKEATHKEPIGEATHVSLIRRVKEYFIIGGMPEAVLASSFLDLDRIHQNLLLTYENDLGKYPKTSQQKFMKLLFEAAPRLVGQHFKYSKIQPHAQSRDYIESLDVLSRTGILHRIFANSASGIPLEAQVLEKKFKLLFMDIGLLPQAQFSILDAEDLTLVNGGDLAEQFVGQELVAYEQAYLKPKLYYWEREKKNAEAEVDYVIQVDAHIIPVEVKSGKKGKLKSLYQFIKEKKSPLGIRISQAPLSLSDSVLSIPFYMIAEIPRLVRQIC
jgi:uncharacterized protein